MKKKPRMVSRALVEHIALIFEIGVEKYVERDIIRLVECPDDRAKLHRLTRELEDPRGGR